MESNAQLVEWEDGKVSLMLGGECFDVSTKPVGSSEHVFLLAHQTGSGALESHTEFTDRMTFRPSGLKSDTHRNLTAMIAEKQTKKIKTKMYFTEKDPELMKQELESQENERLKAQKRLELQRRKADMRYGDVGSRRNQDFGDYDTTDYPSYTNTSRAQDRYEDDFVVDDDEYDEEEERSREDRLSQVKRSGMDKYKRSRYSDEEEEEEEEEEEDYNDDDDDEEEVIVRRHKRNRVLIEEDE